MTSLKKMAYSLIAAATLPLIAFAEFVDLPDRPSPRPATTDRVPHVQLDMQRYPGIGARVLSEIESMPGVETRPTAMSLPGATGFWVKRDVTLTRPDVILSGREFAHQHPDGSFHASLDPVIAKMAVEAGWATYHPWANSRPGLNGFVMIYTPSSEAEAEVVLQLLNSAFEFVTS